MHYWPYLLQRDGHNIYSWYCMPDNDSHCKMMRLDIIRKVTLTSQASARNWRPTLSARLASTHRGSRCDSYPSPAEGVGLRAAIDKVFPVHRAVADIRSGSTILSAGKSNHDFLLTQTGFGLCGTPETLYQALRDRSEVRNLTIVSNNAGNGQYGVSPLIESSQVDKMVMSYLGGNKLAEAAYLDGKLSIELCPQGSLAERLRCGGAGVPGFYTRTGAGEFSTHVQPNLQALLWRREVFPYE